MTADYYYFFLKILRGTYAKLHGMSAASEIKLPDSQGASDILFEHLNGTAPSMIARYGATELTCVLNYLSIKRNDKNLWRYIKGENGDWWWNDNSKHLMQRWSGFFPPTDDNLARFCELMIEDSKWVDILGVYDSIKKGVQKMKGYLSNNVSYVSLNDMNPFVTDNPWSRVLKGKKVLVIHPFSELIENQYKKRGLLFDNKEVLPEFSLKTIKAVQSLGGVNSDFNDWFEALDWMKREMDSTDYEIALIGCGAYGFPLAAYAKRTGHKAVHIGGTLQLLFGIRGKRWENPLFLTHNGTYNDLMNNPNWVRPSEYDSVQLRNAENSSPYL